MMIEQYRAEVRKFYYTQRELGRLSINLTYPTVARLRNECLMLFNDGCNKADLRILTSFLGRPNNGELHESAIRRCDPDKFKALYNFLKRDIKTSEKNFELLAWLIDFQPRQYAKYLFEEKKKRGIVQEPAIPKENPLLSEVFYNETRFRKASILCDKPTDVPMSGIVPGRIAHIGGSRRELQKNVVLSGKALDVKSRQGVTPVQNNAVGTEHKEFNRQEEKVENFSPKSEEAQTQIILEYPSGVKLSVSTSDLAFISKLIRL
jgi:hypothetical protein